MMEAVAKGIIDAPGFFDDPRIQRAWTKCSWSGSSPGSIDPLKEVMASDKKVKLGVSTLERESLEINGSDWRANTMQQGIEADLCEEQGLPYARLQDTKAAPIPPAAGDTTGTGEPPPEGDLGDAGDTGNQGDSGSDEKAVVSAIARELLGD
jgi:capsid protein